MEGWGGWRKEEVLEGHKDAVFGSKPFKSKPWIAEHTPAPTLGFP